MYWHVCLKQLSKKNTIQIFLIVKDSNKTNSYSNCIQLLINNIAN